MNSIKIFTLAGATLFLMAGYMPATAGNLDAELQQKIDDIMKNEQDVSKASVRIDVAPKETSDRQSVDFTEFDLNKDGVYERNEVGEKLFTIFDTDRNGVIDNREMKKVGLQVRVPMEKKTELSLITLP